ncbi:MAG: hypothetical protein IJ678_06170 [Kiritimatiellae bacterium]|nr:hypothetical protein [Kiritimatiellia bacterium]
MKRIPRLAPKNAAALAAAFLCACGCRVRDVRTVAFRVEGLDGPESLARAEAALAKLPDSRLRDAMPAKGEKAERCLKIISADYETGELVVRYDAMKVGLKNLQWELAGAGFGNDGFPARGSR